MKRIKLMSSLMIALALGLAVTGCDSEKNGGLIEAEQVAVDDYDAIDLNNPTGGLTATDEQEAFGDPYLLQLAAVEDEGLVDDELADDPEVRRWERMADQPGDPDDPARPRFTFLRITWGMLDGPVDTLGNTDESVDLLNWSGHIEVDRGVVLVRRVILFERPYDVLGPRYARNKISWISHTGNHFDGLLIEIIEPPADPAVDVATEPNMLHITTAPYTQSFAVADLQGLNEMYPVRPEGNAIQFVGFRLSDLVDCPRGFLGGIWHAVDDNPETEIVEGGIFKGRWVGLLGHLHGFIRGRYGYADDGEPIFVGKYISRSGRFEGFVRGSWELVDSEIGYGVFRGHWINRAETVEGVLGGQYLSLPERPGGFFSGRWSSCIDELDEDAG